MKFHYAILALGSDDIWRLRFRTSHGVQYDDVAPNGELPDLLDFLDVVGDKGWQLCDTGRFEGKPDSARQYVFMKRYQ